MKSKTWHAQDIMAAVRKRGTTMQGLARKNGYAPTTFNKALTQRFPNAHEVIADFIGETRFSLWPQWYDVNDAPLFRSRKDLQRSCERRAA